MLGVLFLLMVGAWTAHAASAAVPGKLQFPLPLESYGDSQVTGLWDILSNRVRQMPFNLWATVIFLGAVLHTFLTKRFTHWAHVLDERHQQNLPDVAAADRAAPVCIPARILHFLGEVEAVFGIWIVPLVVLMAWRVGWQPTHDYLNSGVSYNEPLFVVVIMALASTRPVMRLAEQCLRFFAGLGGDSVGAWWLAILTLGPVLGSVITEPAAMTISALLLGRQFYALKPSATFAHATLGLLFVNVSVGGVLTHFAAPPVLMVAAPWQWTTPFMFRHFGWIALVGILIANVVYYLVFHGELARLNLARDLSQADAQGVKDKHIPVWVTVGQLVFMVWTVMNSHYPALVIGGFLFFLAYYEITSEYQTELQLRSPILVGFFLAGLVVHGGLQQWWIAPVLGRLKELPLMFGAIGLTAFNDNAAITYLATLVPGMTDGMKYAVVAGAVAGGGLTVIANAPNPAGQSILNKYFKEGIAPLGLLLGALPPTIILTLCFILLG